MLDTFRKQTKSIIIYVFFGIIIAVFVVNFGPQAQGVTVTGSFALKVRGETLNENDFRYGLVLLGANRLAAEESRRQRVRERVMDRMIEREIFADEAERMGFRVSDVEAEEMIASGKIIAVGLETEVFKPYFFRDEVIDYEGLRRFAMDEIGITVKRFLWHQKRELLANKFRDLVRNSARTSEPELRDDYTSRQTQVDLEFVRFAPSPMTEEVVVEAPELNAFLQNERQQVEAMYHTHRQTHYANLPKEVRVRHLRVARPAKSSQEAATQVRVQRIAERLKKGDDFALVAKEESDDLAERLRNGDLGWRRRSQTGLGDEIEKSIFAAKAGELLGPVENTLGWHFVRVEKFREGDQKLEAVERDIAEELVRERKEAAALRQQAESYLARIRGGQAWESTFPEEKREEPKNVDTPAPPQPSKPDLVRRSTGFFSSRNEAIPGVGISKELLRDAFQLTKEKPLADHSYEIGRLVYLVKLKERQDVDTKEFEAKKATFLQLHALRKAEEMLAEMSATLCREERPKVNASLVSYGDEEGEYRACSTLGPR